jgi:hypothetical protein
MKIASLVAASLIATFPVAALGQATDGSPAPGTEVERPGPGAPAVPTVKIEKSGGYFGFSLGTGKGTLTSGSSSVSLNDLLGASGQSPTTLALQLRGGWGTGDFLFGTQMNLTRSWVDSGSTTFGLQFLAVDAVVTWWSQDSGFYTRLGLGPSQVSAFGGGSASTAAQGVELMAGLGVTMGSLGVGIDVSRQSYKASEAGFDSVTFVLASLSLDFY